VQETFSPDPIVGLLREAATTIDEMTPHLRVIAEREHAWIIGPKADAERAGMITPRYWPPLDLCERVRDDAAEACRLLRAAAQDADQGPRPLPRIRGRTLARVIRDTAHVASGAANGLEYPPSMIPGATSYMVHHESADRLDGYAAMLREAADAIAGADQQAAPGVEADADLPVTQPTRIDGFTVAEICAELDRSDEWLRKLRKRAGVPGPARGEHGFRFGPRELAALREGLESPNGRRYPEEAEALERLIRRCRDDAIVGN
jgi:hypothetical protein